jgi:hypothetical protein
MGYAQPTHRPEAPTNLAVSFYDGGLSGSQRFFLSFDLPKRDVSTDQNHIAISSIRVYAKNTLENFYLPGRSCSTLEDGDSNCNAATGVPYQIFYYRTIDLSTDATGKHPVPNMRPEAAGITQLTIAFDDEDQSGHVSEAGGDGRWISLPQLPTGGAPVSPHAPGQTSTGMDLGVELDPQGDMEDETSNGGTVEGDPDYWTPDSTELRIQKRPPLEDTWYYKIVGVQCKSFLHGDDGEDSPYPWVIQPSATRDGRNADEGYASDWVVVPCIFGEAMQPTLLGNDPPDPIDETPDAVVSVACDAPFPDNGVTVTVEDGDWLDEDGDDVRACRSRLILQNVHTGDRVSTDWQCYDTEDTGNPCTPCGLGAGQCCDEDSGNWVDQMDPGASIKPGTQFTYPADAVEELLLQLRGRDVMVVAEVKESAAGSQVLTCSGFGACEGRQTASDCVQAFLESPDPRITNDDFTGGEDPLTGTPTGLPDAIPDCYQAVEWTFEEGCISGDLDIKTLKIPMLDSGGSPTTTPRLLRVYWDYDPDTGSGTEIYRSDWSSACSANWPAAGCEPLAGGYWEITDCMAPGGPSNCNDFTGCDEHSTAGCMYFREGQIVTIRMEFETPVKVGPGLTGLRQFGMDFGQYDRLDPDTGFGTASGPTSFVPRPPVLPSPDTCSPCDQDNDEVCCYAANQPDGCPDPPDTGCSGLCSGTDWNDLDPLCTNACLDDDLDGFSSATCYPAGQSTNPCLPLDCDDQDDCVNPSMIEQCGQPFCDGQDVCYDGKDNDCDGFPDKEDRNEPFFVQCIRC